MSHGRARSPWPRLLVPLVGVSGVVFGVFGLWQVWTERQYLHDDLDRRARSLSRALSSEVERLPRESAAARTRFVERLNRSGRILGAAVCAAESATIAVSPTIAELAPCESADVAAVIAGAAERVRLTEDVSGLIHEYVSPVTDTLRHARMALVVVHDASYIESRVTSQLTWFTAVLVLLGLLLSVTAVTSARAIFGGPLDKLADWMRRLRLAEGEISEEPPPLLPSERLALESERLAASLKAARTGAQALARETAEGDRQWTRDRLRAHVIELLDGAQLAVVSNREPYLHAKSLGRVHVMRPASGLVTALDPVLRACGGLWIAHGAGEADRANADAHGRIVVPPGKGRYTLRRIWLTREEEEGYYYGFSNEGFWPLCHSTHERPTFRSSDWDDYRAVNERFAQAVLEEMGSGKGMVLVQDYHLALVPYLIKRERPDLAVSLFWHIPWPNPEAFRICPWKAEILQGMLGADLIGFHVQYQCNNFLDTVNRLLEVRIDWERFGVWQQGRMTHVRPFPISVQPWDEKEVPSGTELELQHAAMRADHKLGDAVVAVGVDRIDYTKGIPDRLRAIGRFLETNPEWIGKFVYVQLGAPSRVHLKRYRDLVTEVEALADEVNWKFQTESWKPIIMLREHHSPDAVYLWLRLADVCIVSSLHDGMNLVAKEFVAARDDDGGVLVLSEFTGAARELADAVIVNPYSTDDFAAAIRRAVDMPELERRDRMRRMRQHVRERNVYRWARDLISHTSRAAHAGDGAEVSGGATAAAPRT